MNTIEFDYKTATAQQIFDHVVRSLLKQGRRSYADYLCCYRNWNGDKCAAGYLIDDTEYQHSMEGKRWITVLEEHFSDVDGARVHLDLITDLQRAHDNCKVDVRTQTFDQDDFNAKFSHVAKKHGLKVDA